MAMKPFEHLRYQSKSPLTITRFGKVLRAIDTGVAAFMPSFFAGMEAAVMILLLSEGSPLTTEGIVRMS